MRNVDPHLLAEKMDEAVTHYINAHQSAETVAIDTNGLPINVQDDGGGRVVMHPQDFSSQICRQVAVGEPVSESGPWSEELMDQESRLAALVAHLAQHSRTAVHHPHPQSPHFKVSQIRNEVDNSVILDTPMRIFNGQPMDHNPSLVGEVPPLTPLPPLQEMKRCPDADWFTNKSKNNLKTDRPILADTTDHTQVLELAGASPAQKQNKKSLPHKKRISRKLKRNTGGSTPQPEIVVISNCNDMPQEILPDNFVTSVQHTEHLTETQHHIAHEIRPIFICQICGEFYGEEQLKFYQHLKQHYEPHSTIIIENPVTDLGIDKMTNTCIVDNVPTLPDSIVELSLENTVPKTIYQPIDKHIMYTSSDKTLNYNSNKVQYSMASMDKVPNVPTTEADKPDFFETLDKLEIYFCVKCKKSFKKQKQCEAHIKEAHSITKLEDMGEFSEPEDLMEGIHVSVEDGSEQYEQTLLPHITVENGHIHQEHARWYTRNGNNTSLPSCNTNGAYCPVCPNSREPQQSPHQEEVLQRIFEEEVPVPETANFTEEIMSANNIQENNQPKDKNADKKKVKRYECNHCDRVFTHRNSLLYHALSHREREQQCKVCGKSFYTANALNRHTRVHNGDRPYKCDLCNQEFRQSGDLSYHKMSKHSTQKMFKCDYCGKEFARKYSLNLHRRIHTGERNYKCDYCNKSFRASSYKLSHMRSHTGIKPHKCEECDKCFSHASDLKRHLQMHEKVRLKAEQQKNKAKKICEENNSKIKVEIKTNLKEEKVDEQQPNPKTVKKVAVASTTRPPNPKVIQKKHTKPKKNQTNEKTTAPNVTVTNKMTADTQFKITEYPNVTVFDSKSDNYKFKEVYTDQSEIINGQYTKLKDAYVEPMLVPYKDLEHRLNEDKEFAVLRLSDTKNTDGKLQIFTHIQKSKDSHVPIITNSQVGLHDIRNIEREVGGETIESGFLEKLTALYNIPAV